MPCACGTCTFASSIPPNALETMPADLTSVHYVREFDNVPAGFRDLAVQISRRLFRPRLGRRSGARDWQCRVEFCLREKRPIEPGEADRSGGCRAQILRPKHHAAR